MLIVKPKFSSAQDNERGEEDEEVVGTDGAVTSSELGWWPNAAYQPDCPITGSGGGRERPTAHA